MMFYDYQYEILNKPEKTFHEKRELVKQLIKLKIRGNAVKNCAVFDLIIMAIF